MVWEATKDQTQCLYLYQRSSRYLPEKLTESPGEGVLFDIWNGGAHILIWGSKICVSEIICCLTFLCRPKLIFRLKIMGHQLIIWGL